ncbi:hypothetical protein [Streptomyces syringium]|uniref:Uncharacterized protein n=1 Tax=Streptomyces syringium TaxID=76729 RepID=A0ABS4XWC4_9ACTN|nr:hypothetical protein [Streptomyces syringium]MBP2400792.1 hypothetical protein [Streptomyces syringium]
MAVDDDGLMGGGVEWDGREALFHQPLDKTYGAFDVAHACPAPGDLHDDRGTVQQDDGVVV